MPIENIHPPLKIESAANTDAAECVVKRVVHLANYNNIQDQDNPDSISYLSGKLLIDLFGLPENYDPTKIPRPDQLLQLETKGNIKIVKKTETSVTYTKYITQSI